jgi:hypothetical protein
MNNGLVEKNLKYINLAKKEVTKTTLSDCLKRLDPFTGIIQYNRKLKRGKFFISQFGRSQANIFVLLQALGQAYVNFYCYNSGFLPLETMPWIVNFF